MVSSSVGIYLSNILSSWSSLYTRCLTSPICPLPSSSSTQGHALPFATEDPSARGAEALPGAISAQLITSAVDHPGEGRHQVFTLPAHRLHQQLWEPDRRPETGAAAAAAGLWGEGPRAGPPQTAAGPGPPFGLLGEANGKGGVGTACPIPGVWNDSDCCFVACHWTR